MRGGVAGILTRRYKVGCLRNLEFPTLMSGYTDVELRFGVCGCQPHRQGVAFLCHLEVPELLPEYPEAEVRGGVLGHVESGCPLQML